MRKLFLLLIILFSVLLSSCSDTVIYDNLDDLLNDYSKEKEWLDNQGFTPDGTGVFIGRYGEGYLFALHLFELIFGIPTYKSTTIEGVEIFHSNAGEFYYYINYKYTDDCIYAGLENIYNHGFLTKDDLLDIQKKFDAWKDEEYPYCGNEHYQIN